jgi:60 kDa SS-A/Ro ribonucleoprotein
LRWARLRPERLRLLQFPARQVCCLAGFSDKTLETLKLLDTDPDALIRVIEAVEL